MREVAATLRKVSEFCEMDDAMSDDMFSMASCTPTGESATPENALEVAVLRLMEEGDAVRNEDGDVESASVREEPTPICLSKFIDSADALRK